MPYLWFAFVSLVWGGSFILMKRGTAWLSPVEIAAWRVIGGALLLALVWWRLRKSHVLKRQDLPAVLLVVACGFVWPFTIQPYLISRVGSGFIGMMVSFTPLLTIASSVVLLKIYPERRQFWGVLGALACMGILIFDGLHRQIAPLHLALAFTVPLCYALANTVIRKSLSHVPALELSLVCLILAGAVLLTVAVATPFARPAVSSEVAVQAVAAVAFLGVVGTGLATYLFNRLIQEQGPLFAGMATNVSPIGAVVFAWLDAEHVSLTQLGALAGVILMVVVVQFGAVRRHSR
ncbi:MAG: DMT family transporter [Planctomycetes bacterium]|nr:DMT family transporter [Planctomycetota bacterium]